MLLRMSAAFETATGVVVKGEGVYAGRIEPGWDIAGNANGGYMIALAGRAMADAAQRPPLSITAHFLSPGKVGDCVIDVDVVRSGRRMATAAAIVTQGGQQLMALLGTFGEQSSGGPELVAGRAPELPDFQSCVRTVPPAEGSGFGDRVHVRVRPSDVGFADGQPSGTPEVCGWFTFDDEPFDQQHVDVFGLLQATDAFVPVCFNAPDVPVAWAPTLELTVHVRGTPAPGPLRCRFSSRFVQDAMFEEDGEIYDSTGRLVAQSRQLALIPRA
jgi:acyl-CoA thioesterase